MCWFYPWMVGNNKIVSLKPVSYLATEALMIFFESVLLIFKYPAEDLVAYLHINKPLI